MPAHPHGYRLGTPIDLKGTHIMKTNALVFLAAVFAMGAAVANTDGPMANAGVTTANADVTAANADVTALNAGESAMPAAKTVGSISYLTGGVGLDQSRAFEKAAPGFPLELEFVRKAKPRDEFTAGVSVSILNAQGETLLSTVADGPFLLAKLPPGDYRVQATDDGKTIVREIKVSPNHHERAVFAWPA
jgi:hypothetical protein